MVLPWFVWARRDDPTSRLRRRILAASPDGPGGERVGICGMMFAAFLHWSRCGRDAWLTWRRLSVTASAGYGVSRWRQLAELFTAVTRYNFPATLYYRCRLFRLSRERWLNVLSPEENTFVLCRFERATAHLGLWTKSGWAAFGAAQGIATPSIAASVREGRVFPAESGGLQVGRDYFVKPDEDYSGRGGLLLEWNASKSGWQASGASRVFVPSDGLESFLINHASRAEHVVQHRLCNDPELADLATKALINFRIVTQRSQEGIYSVLMAGLRLPPGDEPTSDVLGSTLTVPVNLETGELGLIECGPLALGSMKRHPKSGVQVTGRTVPHWKEMQTRALAAHEKIPSMPLVGWDLVATDRGVFILEANAVWNSSLAQLWGLLPLGETPAVRLMLENFDLLATPGKI